MFSSFYFHFHRGWTFLARSSIYRSIPPSGRSCPGLKFDSPFSRPRATRAASPWIAIRFLFACRHRFAGETWNNPCRAPSRSASLPAGLRASES